MQLSELEAQLHEAQIKEDAASRGSVPLQERIMARKAVLEAERALFLAKGEEAAIASEWPILWDAGDPSPHVLTTGLRTYLLYRVREGELDEASVNADSEMSIDKTAIALVEFVHCYACRLSDINEEVLTGHPLFGKGLDFYVAHEVIHSQWLAEVQRINRVHEHYNPAHWTKLKHYLLVFHDHIYECLAEDYRVEVLRDTIEQALELAVKRL